MVLIIGKRSNLSKHLAQEINDSILISSDDIEHNLNDILKHCSKSIDIIFNNFQYSLNLFNSINFDEYIIKSILNTSRLLTFLINHDVNIHRLIYTSSSSVYGNNKFCSESDQVAPMSLQASLKISNEELIKRFCKQNNIQFTIARLFNMYGGDDKFSVISKIKHSYVNSDALTVVNDGQSVRDYIHIDNVVEVYKKILEAKNNYEVLNVAQGKGKRVADILNTLKKEGIDIETKNIYREEISASIADVGLLNHIVDTSTFMDVEDYLISELSN